MITRLEVADFVLIERLSLRLGPGLNVLSGGSGEGKSLVLSALRFACGEGSGGRAAAGRLIRPGAAEARVELELALGTREGPSGELLGGLLRELWGEEPADERLTLVRTLQQNGRGRCTIGGRPLGLVALRRLGGLLLESFTQGAASGLLEEAQQRSLLDAYAGLGDEVAAYERERSDARVLAEELDALRALEERLEAEWSERCGEHEALAELDPQPGEFEQLRARVDRLEAQRAELGRLNRASLRLQEADGALVDQLQELGGELNRLAERWPRLAEAVEVLGDGIALLDEVAQRLIAAREATEVDGAELEELSERLAAFQSLARRLRTFPAALAGRWEELREQGDPSELSARIGRRETELEGARRGLARRARRLSTARRKAARELGAATQTELPALGLPTARFGIAVHAWKAPPASPLGALDALDASDPWTHGRDRIELSFSANAGHPPGPLREASGGELSRLFLALGVRVADRERVGVLLLDEVDQNVGARLGGAVGACLASIARGRQIICVTHLAPVAARADRHLRIRKEGGTCHANLLQGAERVEELALMIKGQPVTPAARAQAEELLSEARDAEPSVAQPTQPKSKRRSRRGGDRAA